MDNLNKDNRPNQILTIELPADLCDYVMEQARNRKESESEYIRRLILIDSIVKTSLLFSSINQ